MRHWLSPLLVLALLFGGAMANAHYVSKSVDGWCAGVEASLAAADPHYDALRHCQNLGAAGAEDPECLAAWAQQRDRFLHRPVPTEVR